jgi:hypothetical protein
MGLAQKRISKDFQDNAYPSWKKSFDQMVGFEIPIEVKWDTMMSDDYSDKDSYFDWYRKVYFDSLTGAFKNLCQDDMGKEAVKSGVKKIVIDGTEGYYSSHSTFEDGVFNLNHKFCSNVDSVDERVKDWAEMIGNKL